MKKYRKSKLLSVTFFLLVLALIFGLTIQNSAKSAALSQSIQRFIQATVEKYEIKDEMLQHLASTNGYYFRKYAHTVEYFMLGIATSFLLKKSKCRFLNAFALCAVISVADQSLKLLVPGREFDWTDFPYDAMGSVLGIIFVQIVNVMKRIISKRYEKNCR